MSKKEIKLLTYWQYDIKSKEFDKFMEDLNVIFCGYMFENVSEIRTEKIFNPLYLYNGIEYYKNIKPDYELDKNIIDSMQQYELTAMDIINRWRRSYIKGESYKDVRELYFIFLRFWNNYILTNEINLLILNIMPHIPMTYLPYALCKVYNIPIIIQGIIPFTVGRKINYILKPDIDNIDLNFKLRYDNYLKKYQNKEFEEIMIIPELKEYFSQYIKQNFNSKRVIYYNTKNSFLETTKQYYERMAIYIKRNDLKLLINKMLYLFKIRFNSKIFLKKVEKIEENIDFNSKFYFFPLHLQPEATTLPNGGVFVDQLLAIKMISKNLPSDTFLYVKEHPSYWIMKKRLEGVKESRSINFYNEIKALKNVKLINHKYNSLDLIEKCKCLVTVTGTAGFEAIFNSKPVMLFGNAFYEYFPNVFKIQTNKDCSLAIKKISEENFYVTKKLIAIYLKSLEKYIVPLGANEKNFQDNGTPKTDINDRILITDKLKEFYREYYEEDKV